MQFSTINESSLHKTLKLMYAEIYEGNTEVSLDGHVYDIVTKNNNVIEIQTKNLSHLFPKVQDVIQKGHNIKIVHPISLSTDIYLYNKEGKLLKKSKSTKKGSIYDLFKEVTKLYPYLLNPHFSLEIVEITMKEIREKEDSYVQSRNGRRRFKKDWLKKDKSLIELIDTKIFNNKEDYLSLLPKSLPEEFCAKDLSLCLKKEKLAPARIYNNSNIIPWILTRIELIKETQIKNKTHYYKINK